MKIEPYGCRIHKGLIQVKLCFYLEPTDPRYNEHHVYVIDETSREWLRGYKGKVDATGNPIDKDAYDTWFAALPHIWRDNPFNNHFIYVDVEATGNDILKQAHDSFNEFFGGWCESKDMMTVWQSKLRPQFIPKVLTSSQLALATTRLAQIKEMVI